MALKNTETNEYLKVSSMNFDFLTGNHQVNYLLFADSEQRQRFETGLSPYEVYGQGIYNGIGHIENSLASSPEGISDTKQAMFKACYTALKADVFVDWVDC